MMTLKYLLTSGNQAEYKGAWIPAKPMAGPLIWRLRDAWAVAIGKAEAVSWPVDYDLPTQRPT